MWGKIHIVTRIRNTNYNYYLPVTISAAVTDGVTLGHPCCNVDDCKDPLARVTDEYCHKHLTEETHCCVKDCIMPREPGHRTCPTKEHREEENRRKMRTRVLKYRKKPTDEETEKDAGRRKKLKGSFSRRWTHNEQLIVRPCGIVIGRATLYASENVVAVKVSKQIQGLKACSTYETRRCFYEAYFPRAFQDWNQRFSFSTMLVDYANI